MSVLVTGATGTVGSVVVSQLVAAGLDVRAFTRSPEKATFAPGVTPVSGRSALRVKVCRRAHDRGIQHAGDHIAPERVHAEPGRQGRSRPRRVPVPDGQKGVSFTDVRDIAEVAVLEIQRRLAAREALGPETCEVVAEDVLTGETGAELWSEAPGRPVRYIGDDLDQWIQGLRAFAPSWMAYDFTYMMKHFQEDGPVSTAAGLERLRQRLGRSPRSCRDYAAESAQLRSAASS